jgi:hypothetical protein
MRRRLVAPLAMTTAMGVTAVPALAQIPPNCERG